MILGVLAIGLTGLQANGLTTFLTEIGFAVAFGILPDTIVVRSVLVTALNLDIGRWMWWPSALARKPDPAPQGTQPGARRCPGAVNQNGPWCLFPAGRSEPGGHPSGRQVLPR